MKEEEEKGGKWVKYPQIQAIIFTVDKKVENEEAELSGVEDRNKR
jgi:hypothetical protein